MQDSRMHGDILRTRDEAGVTVPRHVIGTKYGEAGFVNPCWDLTADEFADLKERIRTQGFSPAFPIIRSAGPFAPGALVDGFHREAVCEQLSAEGHVVVPVYVDLPFETEAEFRIAQIDGNLKRRQLSDLRQAVLVRERESWAEQLRVEEQRKLNAAVARASRAGDTEAAALIRESFPTSELGRSRDKLGGMIGVSGRTYEKLTYAYDHGDDFIREELDSGRRGADWGFKAAKEWRDAEAETGQSWSGYTDYRAWVEEQKLALDHQAQWDKEYGELFNHDAGVDTEARTKGHDGAYVRTELERLDRYWESHRVVDGIVVDGAAHTFRGVLVRWHERLADMLKCWDAQ